jgi:hypothetical protein
MSIEILMPALSSTSSLVMARLDRAIHPARVHATKRLHARMDGPLLRAMTLGEAA